MAGAWRASTCSSWPRPTKCWAKGGNNRSSTLGRELGGTLRLIQEKVEEVKPSRIVFDSLSEMRLLAQDPLRYRRQVLALKQFFAGRNITVVLVDDLTGENGQRDAHLHSLCHGVISLERLTLDFGAARRRLEVQKMRGVDFIAGFHDFTVRTGGLEIYPRMNAAEHHSPFAGDPTPSGVAELDSLLAGGPLRGTTTLITGPAGSGKTTVALQYLCAACERGEAAGLFEFDERVGTMRIRARAMGLDLQKHVDSGLLTIMQINPAEIARTHRPKLPILFITGYAENAAIRAGFLGTNMSMVTKPFRLDDLAAKISEMTGASE